MKNRYIILLFLLTLFSCNNENSKVTNNKNFSEKPLKNKTTVNNDEKFNDFFIRFSSDSTFQSSRVHFPIRVMELNTEKLSDETIILNKNNYYFQNIDLKSKDYKINEEVKNDSAKVTLKGIENGIFMEIFFYKKNGIWWLKTWNNFST